MDFQEFEQKRRNRKWIQGAVIAAAVILVLLSCYFFLFHINQFEINITLNGAQNQTLEYGTSYEDDGAMAVLHGSHILKKGIELPVSVCSTVDDGRIGTYTVSYEAEFCNLKNQVFRTISVVDTIAPKIILTYNEDYFVLPNHEYEEEGFVAQDNYDGDITSKVLCQDKGGIVHYYVEDSSGNAAMVTRQIRYDDPIAPELVLVGDLEMTISAGQAFVEPGYAASDNYDGDLTPLVQVSGAVDHYHAGTYVLTYAVTDSFGNATTIDRTVHVAPRPQAQTVTPTGKVIYLTFDDGPSQYTQKLLDVLNLYNVKATFFVVNSDYIHLVDDMIDQGHAVGMHSVSHNYRKIYANEEAYFNDLYGIQKIIEEQCGHKSTLLRFPGGSSNTVSSFNKGIMTRLTQAVEDLGLQYFDWNVSSGDAEGATTSDQVFQNVINGVQKRSVSIVLQHDTKDFSVEAVGRIIIWALENGYTFLALDATSPTAHHGVNN